MSTRNWQMQEIGHILGHAEVTVANVSGGKNVPGMLGY